ncbi:hypothetical protein [Raineyella antarctica]|nr:hypothetical protein [Raineyella antarctica]
MAPLSIASVWVSTVLSDTDRYVATVAPLAEDPAVRDALAEAATTTVTDALEQAGRGVPEAITGPINRRIEALTREQVDALLASPRFPELWAQLNRDGHRQVVGLLEGNQDGTLSAPGGAITVNVAPIVAAAKADLESRGFGLARIIPVVDRSFVLVHSGAIARGQHVFRLLDTLGGWSPVVTLVVAAAGVVLARDRRRAGLLVGLGVAASMLAFGIALTLLRGWFVGTTPAEAVSPVVAGAYFDALAGFLWTWLGVVGALGLVVASGCWLVGPSAGRLAAITRRPEGDAPRS